MERLTHSEWYAAVSELREIFRADPTNYQLAVKLWHVLDGSAGFDVRSGHLAIDTFRGIALQSKLGVATLATGATGATTG